MKNNTSYVIPCTQPLVDSELIANWLRIDYELIANLLWIDSELIAMWEWVGSECEVCLVRDDSELDAKLVTIITTHIQFERDMYMFQCTFTLWICKTVTLDHDSGYLLRINTPMTQRDIQKVFKRKRLSIT